MPSRRLIALGVAAVLALTVGATGLWWYSQPAADAETAEDDLLPIPPLPPRIAEGDDYDKCLSMLNADPSGALDFADAWEDRGGGDGAVHCHALSQIALGDPEHGADMLDKLAARSNAPPSSRAAVLGQAAQAWMMANAPDRAFGSSTRALALTQDDPDLLIDRAIAALSLQRYRDAADDLGHALELDPTRVDALVLRASAWRLLGDLEQAQDDVDRAFAQDPENPDAFLERGILRQRSGDWDGARDDWQRAISLAPDSATGDLAQQNLALLEAGPDQR